MDRNNEKRFFTFTLAKSLELSEQLNSLQKINLRHTDKNNARIESLENEWMESEIQYSNALKGHLINIDTLTALQDSRLETVRNLFDNDVMSFELDFNTERYNYY